MHELVVEGIQCLITLQTCEGSEPWFNGYCVIPDDAMDFCEENEYSFDVHGGISWCGSPIKGVSDKPLIGYDCNHYGDNIHVENLAYNIEQVTKLASQIAKREVPY
jgi:hypothetical protein